jgi:protein-tyrosine-phosphatase
VRAKPNLRSPERLVQIAQARGVDLEGRRSVRIVAAHVMWADLILVMDADNFGRIAADFPEAVTKMTLLGLFAPGAHAVIRDPDTTSEDAMLDVLDQIREAVNGLTAWLRADDKTNPAVRRRPQPAWSLTAAVEAAVAGRLPGNTCARSERRARANPSNSSSGERRANVWDSGKSWGETVRPVTAGELSSMCGALAHRGPDDEGAYLGSGVGNLHAAPQHHRSRDGTSARLERGRVGLGRAERRDLQLQELRHALECRGHRFPRPATPRSSCTLRGPRAAVRREAARHVRLRRVGRDAAAS